MIPLFYPPNQDVEEMLRELRDTLESRWWGQGPKVNRFEREFGEMFDFEPRHCVMTNSGTAALHLAYAVAGIGEGSWVGVPVLTCSATCHPILLLEATPKFLDINRRTLCLDTESESFRTHVQGFDAIVPVHLGGCVVPEFDRSQRWYDNAVIIEDAAQALGAKGVGWGDFTAFSFQAIKALSTGDGGMLVCKDVEAANEARRLRWFDIDREAKIGQGWQAVTRRGITSDQRRPGYKYQPTDIDACLGLAGLKTVERDQRWRHHLANVYREHLIGVKGLQLLDTLGSADWLFHVLVTGMDRNEFGEKMLDAGVEVNVAHVRNDMLTVFGGKRQNLPNMNWVEDKYLCLPLHSRLTEADVVFVCDAAKRILTESL